MISVIDENNAVQHLRIKKIEAKTKEADMGRKKYKFRVRGANEDELFDDVATLLEYYKDKIVYRGAPLLGKCLRRDEFTKQSKWWAVYKKIHCYFFYRY